MSIIITNPLETDIFNYRSKDFFVNLRPQDIPTIDSNEWDDFVDWEEHKCKAGINVNGIFIPPTLYFHLNHWKMLKDVVKGEGGIMSNPDFRDNEWIIHNAIWECENNEKDIIEALVQGGCRQIGKTVNMASIISRDLTILDNITDLIACSSQDDIDAITRYIFPGMDNTTWFLRVPRITQNRSDNDFVFGHKDIQGNDIVKSRLLTRNTQGGKKTQVTAGNTIFRAVWDEIGKAPTQAAFEATKPATISSFGYRAASMISFTGGEVKNSKDAELIFYNPSMVGAKEFDVEGRKTGLFLSGLFRQDLKVWTTVGEQFGLSPDNELYDFPLKWRDEKYGYETLSKEIAIATNSPSNVALINHRIYQPMVTGDMFLTPDVNPFPVDGLLRHKEWLLVNRNEQYVDLFRNQDTGKVDYQLSHKRPIDSFPLKEQNVNKDAPIVIYSFPKYTEHYNLHVIGHDPYNQDDTVDSDSLGSVYVMRRMHSDLKDSYQNCMVASYTARPKSLIKDFCKNLELLQEYYNGEILFEDSGGDVLAYFDSRNKGNVLMDTFDLQKEINPTSHARNKKGLKANKHNNARRLGAMLEYMEEELDNGLMGYTRILDPVLIDEFVAYNGMGEGTRNTDRIDAFSLALLQLQSLQKFISNRPFIVRPPGEAPPKKKPIVQSNAFGIKRKSNKRTAFGF